MEGDIEALQRLICHSEQSEKPRHFAVARGDKIDN